MLSRPELTNPQNPPSQDALFHVLWRRRAILGISMLLAVAAGVAYLLLATSVYTSEAKIRYPQLMPRITDNGVAAVTSSESFLNTEAEVISSTSVLLVALGNPSMEQVELFQTHPNPIRALKDGLKVRLGHKADLITISYSSPNRFDAQTVVASVVDAYRTFHAKERQDALDALERERQKIVDDLAVRSRELAAFQKENSHFSFDDDEHSNPIRQRLASISEALTQAHLDAVNAKATYEEAAQAVAGDAELQRRLGGLTTDDTRLTVANEEMLRNELFSLQQRLEEAKRQYGMNHPLVGSIQGRIDHLTVAFVGVARDRWLAAQRRQEELERTYETLQQQAAEYQLVRTRYDQIRRDVQRLERLEEEIADRMRSMSMVENSGALNVTVLENATLPDKPSAPRKEQVFTVALAGGLFIGLGLALLVDWRDQRLRSAEEIKAALGVPMLGTVPAMAGGVAPNIRGLKSHLDPASEAARAYRSLRTNAYFALPDTARTILVTSPSSGDGKSTLVSNLAISMAQAGRRVLIIDANCRFPVQHKIFALSTSGGLAGVLAGRATLEQAIVPTGIENLDLLPCGATPADPADLLNNQDFSDLLGDLASRYDYVLLDSPAITAAADARIASAWCDATLLVLHAERTERRLAQLARDALVAVGANLVGVVVNAVDGHSRKHNFAIDFDTADEHQPAYDPQPLVVPQASHSAAQPHPLDSPAAVLPQLQVEVPEAEINSPSPTEPGLESQPEAVLPESALDHEDDHEPNWPQPAETKASDAPASETAGEKPQPAADNSQSADQGKPPAVKPILQFPKRESRNIVTGLTPEKLAETSAELRRKFEALR